eukprot:m.257864 g.257864  ORF g.257864 m.257864 type:complete len:257 (+) comp21106_c0_seq1:13-783(+)
MAWELAWQILQPVFSGGKHVLLDVLRAHHLRSVAERLIDTPSNMMRLLINNPFPAVALAGTGAAVIVLLRAGIDSNAEIDHDLREIVQRLQPGEDASLIRRVQTLRGKQQQQQTSLVLAATGLVLVIVMLTYRYQTAQSHGGDETRVVQDTVHALCNRIASFASGTSWVIVCNDTGAPAVIRGHHVWGLFGGAMGDTDAATVLPGLCAVIASNRNAYGLGSGVSIALGTVVDNPTWRIFAHAAFVKVSELASMSQS